MSSNRIWVEKYRPKSLDEVIGNEAVRQIMQDNVDDPSMPDLMFIGPAGTGKTTTAEAFARDKYGDEWRNHFKSLNASDDRGIDTIRNDVKEFARLSPVSDYEFKIIFLDEADSLTNEAQSALRRVMEEHDENTRFILSCNYPNKIIDPIQSRTTQLRMSPIEEDKIFDMLCSIADQEGVVYSDDQIREIARYADGDARSAIYTLQTGVSNGELKDALIDALVSFPSREEVEEIFEMALVGDEQAMDEMESLVNDGVDIDRILEITVDIVKRHNDLPQDAKVKLLDVVGDTEWRIKNGSNPHVQLNRMIANITVGRHLSLAPYRKENEQ